MADRVEDIVVVVTPTQPMADEDLAELTTHLRAELLTLDVERVERIRTGEVPQDAKAGVLETLGALLVKAGPSLARPVVRAVKSWLARGRDRSAELVWKGNRLRVTGVSSEEQERLINTWIKLVEEG